MEFFGKQTNIDFLGIKVYTAILSIVLVLASIAGIAIKGLNWGLDFTGGYALEVQYPSAPDLAKVRAALSAVDFSHADVVQFGSSRDIRIVIQPKYAQHVMKNKTVNVKQQTASEKLQAMVQEALGAKASIKSVNFTGPEVGKELAETGILAMLIAVIATMIYIAMRFEMRFAISSAIALAHDPILILGVFAWFQFHFDLTALAAILAIIGYSLNDTVVVYDRVRENFKKMAKASVEHVVNRAINDTLSRTIMTSGFTLLVVVVLFYFGGPSIHYFSLALVLGVIIGTYSSIYVAGALAVVLGLSREALYPDAKPIDDMP